MAKLYTTKVGGNMNPKFVKRFYLFSTVTFGILAILLSILFCYSVIYGNPESIKAEKVESQEVMVNTVMKGNYNLVFYKDNCPYCEVAESKISRAVGHSKYPSYYIDIESKDGQLLKSLYGVEFASTIVSIRDGKGKLALYAKKDKNKQITVDEKTIEKYLVNE